MMEWIIFRYFLQTRVQMLFCQMIVFLGYGSNFKLLSAFLSQTKAHLTAIFTWNARGHWRKRSSTQVKKKKKNLHAQCFCLKWNLQLFFLLYADVVVCLHFRCRTLSGSPRPKSFKKIHLVNNMKQHDMRNGRYGRQTVPVLSQYKSWLNDGRLPQSMKCSFNVSHITGEQAQPVQSIHFTDFEQAFFFFILHVITV